MIYNYFKAILRNLIKNKGYSVLNIGGLAIGISSCILIFMYVSFEFNYDKYHSDHENIFRIAQIGKSGEIENIDPKTVPPLANFLKENLPEVESAARFQRRWDEMIKTDNNSFWTDKIFAVDNEIFNILNINFIEGDKKTALTQPFTTVITKEIAEKFFGEESAIGKTIKIGPTDYEITGVIENPPDNTHWKYNILITSVMPADRQFMVEKSWIFNIYYTYIKLLPDTDTRSFEKKINEIAFKYAKDKWKKRGYTYTYFLQPVSEIHLNPLPINEIEQAGDSKSLYIFILVAVLILSIACINYINMNTARAAKRAKEIGIRKIIGGKRSQLIKQFLLESILVTLISALLSILIIDLLLPVLNNVTGLNFISKDIFNTKIISIFFTLIVLISILSGIFPAFFMSGFKPVNAVKGKIISNSRSVLRRVLVSFQFFISIILITSTIIVYNQLNYINKYDLGIDIKQKIVIPMVNKMGGYNKYEAAKNEFLRNPNIIGVTNSESIIDDLFFEKTRLANQNKDEGIFMNYIFCDTDFIPDFKINIIEGRGFQSRSDTTMSYILNEAAAKILGWDSPAESIYKEIINEWSFYGKGEIVGVCEDFHYEGLQYKIEPLILGYKKIDTNIKTNEKQNVVNSDIIISVSPINIDKTISNIKEIYQKFFPDFPIHYYFLEDSYDLLYMKERNISKIFSLFTILGIFIACLGLFGMASYTAEQRTKEIGVRKVLGSSVSGVVIILLKEFSRMVILANILAWPVGLLLMKNWLNNFAYQTPISIWTFIIAGLLSILIAILTVSYQTITVATKNPADSLRNE